MATYSPFFKLPFAVGGVGIGAVASGDMRPMFAPAPETDALAHWDLGNGVTSLSDLLTGRALVPANAAPTYDATGVLIASGGMHGLVTDIADKANGFTIALVLQPQQSLGVTGQSAMFQGTMTVSGGDGFGGGMYTNGSPGGTINFLANARNAGVSQQLLRTITPLDLGNRWYFYLISVDAAGNRFAYVPGFNIVTDVTTKTPSATRKIALGNAYYSDPPYYFGQKFSEFMVWDRGLTQAEAVAVAQRSRDRLAYKKGISLYGM